jgi:DNA-binding NarL/FixJ family response regulator
MNIEVIDRKNLTDKESQVLSLLAAGYKTDGIAKRVYASPKTVEIHLSNIYAKLDIQQNELNARVRAVSEAWANNIIRLKA